MKTCSTCDTAKPLEDFNKNKRAADGRHWVCRACSQAYMRVFNAAHRSEIRAKARARSTTPEYRAAQKLYRAANPEIIKNQKLRNSYGIGLPEWCAMFASQGSCCDICKTAKPNPKWATDHCHKTGKIRGILCSFCNRMLGLARDDADTLRSAARYLEKHGC